MRLYELPLNYYNNRTSTTATTVAAHIDSVGFGTGDAREFTSIFVVGKNILSYSYSTGGDPETVTLPETVMNDSKEEVPILVGELQYYLHDITQPSETKTTAQSISISFTPVAGQTMQIHEVLILNEMFRNDISGEPLGIDIYDINELDLGSVDEGLTGRQNYTPPINNERDRWQVEFLIKGVLSAGIDTRKRIETLRLFFRNNKNFVCGVEPNRFPSMLAPCILPNRERQLRWLGRSKRSGRTMRFTVREA